MRKFIASFILAFVAVMPLASYASCACGHKPETKTESSCHKQEKAAKHHSADSCACTHASFSAEKTSSVPLSDFHPLQDMLKTVRASQPLTIFVSPLVPPPKF